MLIRASIVRWDSDYFPGIVECRFTDRFGKEWVFVEKLPIVSSDESLDSTSSYPQPGWIACELLSQGRDELNREIVEVDTERPWGVWSVDDVSRFHLFRDQLSDRDVWMDGQN